MDGWMDDFRNAVVHVKAGIRPSNLFTVQFRPSPVPKKGSKFPNVSNDNALFPVSMGIT